jgi:hypothetical protein
VKLNTPSSRLIQDKSSQGGRVERLRTGGLATDGARPVPSTSKTGGTKHIEDQEVVTT